MNVMLRHTARLGLRPHDASTDSAVLDQAFPAGLLGGAFLGGGHATASAFLCHLESPCAFVCRPKAPVLIAGTEIGLKRDYARDDMPSVRWRTNDTPLNSLPLLANARKASTLGVTTVPTWRYSAVTRLTRGVLPESAATDDTCVRSLGGEPLHPRNIFIHPALQKLLAARANIAGPIE
jgi:hypothetical protein